MNKEINTIRGILEYSKEKFRDNVAFKIKDISGCPKQQLSADGKYREITYKDFMIDVRMLATAMIEDGCKNVAIIGKNSYYWALTYYAAVCAGLVVVPLDKGLPSDEIASCIKRSHADVLYFDPNLIGNVKEALEIESLPGLKLNTWGELPAEEAHGLGQVGCLKDALHLGRECLLEGDTRYDSVKIDPYAMAVILFTSGTSGKSKAVMLSNSNIASCVYGMTEYISFRDTDVNIAFLPFHHTFGSTGLLMMLVNGVCNVFCDGLKYVQKNIQEYGVSVFVAVPLLVENMHAKIIKQAKKEGSYEKLRKGLALSNFLRKLHIDMRRKLFRDVHEALGGRLRMIICGASAINPEVAKDFNDMGIITIQGYGLTETSPTLAAQPIGCTDYDSTGPCLCNVEGYIESPDENGVGELVVKGPNVMLGYYEDPEETAKVLKDGWFHTGDLARMDKRGYIFLKGRKKNVIVLKNGKNVFPEELEDLVAKLPYVKENVVFGEERERDLTDSTEDLTVSVIVVYDRAILSQRLPEGTAPSEEAFQEIVKADIDTINEELPVYKMMRRVHITEEDLEKTTTMKIKRYKVLDKAKNI